jgi:hypothetical protein
LNNTPITAHLPAVEGVTASFGGTEKKQERHIYKYRFAKEMERQERNIYIPFYERDGKKYITGKKERKRERKKDIP